MPDLYDYVLHGVMPGHWVTPHLPDGLERELEEGALDYADSVVMDHRRRDRLFDAMCDDRSHQWIPIEAPFTEIREGSCVAVAPSTRRPQWLHGQVESLSDSYGRTEVSTTSGRFWADEWTGGCRLIVPIPVDLSTLGHFAPEVAHRD